MFAVVLVLHLIVVCVLVGVIMLQRSEGGALGGLGGGGAGLGGFISGRGAANILTRTTAILAAVFFGTSIVLSVIAGGTTKPRSILDAVPESPAPTPAPAPATPASPSAPLPQ